MTSPRRRIALAAAVTAALVAVGGGAIASTSSPAIHTTTPRTAHDITNIDVLRQQIRNYYGDPLGTGVVGAHSNYVKEVHRIEARAKAYLAAHAHHHGKGTRAIVLDVDDTSLVTWNYEVASNWAFNSTTNTQYVTEQRFPAVPGMRSVADYAVAHGYKVFFITGRSADKEAATLGNLGHDGVGVDAGFPAPTDPDGTGPEDGLYTKPALADYPAYLTTACAGDPGGVCTTIHYKSATRKHLESLGYDVVANFGDQFSDLKGGYADKRVKLPNPNYYLP